MSVMCHSHSAAVVAWRHPRPIGAQGRCIGRTDLAVDRRKVKRLAHRIRQAARRHGWPQVVHSSSLRRCADVGRQLRRWGWRHHIDDALLEMDFGTWDGLSWSAITLADVDVWCANFAHHAPGGGESLRAMLDRVCVNLCEADVPRLIVAHAGWMIAAQWLQDNAHAPRQAADWPQPPRYGECWQLPSTELQYRPTTPASRK